MNELNSTESKLAAGWDAMAHSDLRSIDQHYSLVCMQSQPARDVGKLRHSDTGDNPDSDTEEVDYDLLSPPPKLTCFKQAIEALEDVQVFLEHRGYVEQATSVGNVMIKC